MIDRIVVRALNGLIRNNFINESEIELYRFGINRLLSFWLNIATTVVIGIICDMVWQSIVFIMAYIPLRRFAGGYHAKTTGRCYILSIILVWIGLGAILFFEQSIFNSFVALGFSDYFIIKKAPVESNNKPLNRLEKKAFRKRTRVILATYNLIVIIVMFQFKQIASIIIVAITCSAIMLLLPKD